MPGRARFTRSLQPNTVVQLEPETLLPSLFFVHRTLGSLMPGLDPNGRGRYGLQSGLSPIPMSWPPSLKARAG